MTSDGARWLFACKYLLLMCGAMHYAVIIALLFYFASRIDSRIGGGEPYPMTQIFGTAQDRSLRCVVITDRTKYQRSRLLRLPHSPPQAPGTSPLNPPPNAALEGVVVTFRCFCFPPGLMPTLCRVLHMNPAYGGAPRH